MKAMTGNRYRLIAAALCVAAAAASPAQEDLTNTITVDRIIVPEERAATRLTINPALLPAKTRQVKLDFTEYALPSELTRGLMYTPPYPWGDSLSRDNFRGRARLGYLPAYHLTAGVGYRAIDSENTLLDVCASFDGQRHTWKQQATAPDGTERSRNFARRNRARLDAGLLHTFGSDDYLKASARYEYFAGAYNSPWSFGNLTGGRQRNCFETSANSFDMDVTYKGSVREAAFTAGVRAGVFAFGKDRDDSNDAGKALRQISGGLTAGLEIPVGENNRLNISADADFYNYNSGTSFAGEYVDIDAAGEPFMAFAPAAGMGFTRMLLTLRPSWTYSRGAFKATAGARIDFANHAAHTLRVAPDVKVSFVPNAFLAFYAQAAGGEYVNTPGSLMAVSDFIGPSFIYGNSSIPLRLRFGINLGAYKGLSARLEAEYARADGVLMPALAPRFANFFLPVDAKAWIAGGTVGYDFRSVAGVRLSYKAKLSTDRNIYYAWTDMAKSIAEVKLTVRPIKPLELNAGLEYRAGRRMLVAEPGSLPVTVGLRNAVNLKFDARYSINDRLGLFADLSNLLGHKYYDVYMIAAPLFAGHVGVTFKF